MGDTFYFAYNRGHARASAEALRLHKLIASDHICTLGRSVEAICEVASKAGGIDLHGDGYGDIASLAARLRTHAETLDHLLRTSSAEEGQTVPSDPSHFQSFAAE